MRDLTLQLWVLAESELLSIKLFTKMITKATAVIGKQAPTLVVGFVATTAMGRGQTLLAGLQHCPFMTCRL